jgi:CPA2 family monovalent cation:H+ antiporter-2
VPEALEGSLMLASHALALVGVPMRRVIRITRDARDARYSLLRGYFHGADDDTLEELEQARLYTINLASGAACIGQTLSQQGLAELEVQVVSVRKVSGVVMQANTEIDLQTGDTLVLSGRPDALTLAEQKLLQG